MTNVTAERKFTNDYDVWEIFVGGMTPKQFIAPYGGDVETAISEFITQDWPWDDEAPPTWLEESLRRSIED
jgi:hypothetical protein